MKKRSLKILVDFVTARLGERPLDEQIRIYQALAEIMPTKAEREKASKIALVLSEALAAQLDFSKQLFRELQWPGHRHDGDGSKGN